MEFRDQASLVLARSYIPAANKPLRNCLMKFKWILLLLEQSISDGNNLKNQSEEAEEQNLFWSSLVTSDDDNATAGN